MKVVVHSRSERLRSRRGNEADLPLRPVASESGVALIITLLLLAVITFMAIAFLVLSRGQKSSVTTTTDMTVARGAAENALARAEAEMMAPILAWTNPMNVGMLVSTNYINSSGFWRGSGPTFTSPTNVSYNYANGQPLNQGGDALQNLANLLYNPRPPVFITNRLRGGYDFRYYLDLNRNGGFDPTGWIRPTNDFGLPLAGSLSYQVGDPQWIGGLEFPDHPHSANNRFTYRYAYAVVPISQTLDINYIHNQARRPEKTTINPNGDDFLRNQGVGTWEINLASFLYDLNTNIYAWGGRYVYQPLPPNSFINGNAFVDACSLLTARYGGINYPSSLATVAGLYANGRASFANDHVDGYSAGPILTTASTLITDPDTVANRTVRPWPGADNTNHFFSPQDFFDPNKTSASFANRLLAVASHTNTYDRYTFYRLLSQLGTDSAPDPANKINLNYDNLARKNVEGISSATNFFPWTPMDFFTNTANALLANAGFDFTITNIQIYPTNYYTAGVHRLLQMAVNIYDSTTNRTFTAREPYCPTVLRPLFRRTTIGTNNNVVIVAGYREVFGTALAGAATGPRIVEIDNGNPTVNVQQIPAITTPAAANERQEPLVSGMPLVIGAKKGFPNFNEFAMQTYVYVSRLMEFRRAKNDTTGKITETNLMYVLTITNRYGLEAWNSYSNAYPRNLQLVASVGMTPVVTGVLDNGSLNPPLINLLSNRANVVVITNIAAGTWRGWPALGQEQFSFVLPWNATNYNLFTKATYVPNPVSQPSLEPETHVFPAPPNNNPFYVPHWVFNLNTRLRFILVDIEEQRIVDYVNLNNWDAGLDITAALAAGADCSGNPASLSDPATQWCTNRVHNGGANVPTVGMINQISVGLGLGNADLKSFSMDPYSGRDVESAVDGFRFNLMGWSPQYPKDTGKQFYKSNVFYAPFDPYRPLFVHTALQANDPLVHYTIGDLTFTGVNVTNVTPYSMNPPLPNIGQINDRYEPWGGNPYKSTAVMPPLQVAAKDPMVRRSDDWDFPTNKYPNIGWLGRVHRGTPWQTVYLKSSNILHQAGAPLAKNLFAWQSWTGNYTNGAVWTYNRSNSLVPLYPGNNYVLSSTNVVFPDAVFTLPTNDWRILDLFTTAFNDNATRGKLSVNQTNLAAWSAVLAGVNILSNTTSSGFIEPAGVYNPNGPPASQPPLVQILSGPGGIINARTNFPNNTFQRLGDILAAPALTIASPYLVGGTNIINDEVVERIPQQVLGLLRGGEQPRFLIYSYGQTLRPAEHSVISSGQFLGLCTNYQITAEVATRAVVRIDGAPRNPHAVIESFNVLPPD